jgi:hypothetical protein
MNQRERALSAQRNRAYDAVQRFYRNRFMPLPVVRSIDRSVVLSSSWAVSGALFGLASGLILRQSPATIVLTVVIAGALSWLARGVANLVLACIVVLISIAAAFQATHYLFSGANLSLSWLGPCAVGGLILLLLLSRRLKLQLNPRGIASLIELIAAVAALLVAVRFVLRVSPGGSDHAALFLIGAEDNDAWLNLVGILRSSNGATQLTGSSMGVVGSVIPTYLAFVRAASGGFFHAAQPFSSSSKTVLSAYGLSIATAPIVAALLVRRMLHFRRSIAALLVWGSVAALVVSYCIIVTAYGSLSVSVAILLMLTAAYLVAVRPRLRNGRAQVVWLGSILLLFGAGSAWVPLTPLAGVAIAASCLPVLGFVMRDRDRRRIIPALLLCLVALFLVLELWQQYRFAAASGGINALFAAPGATPAITEATQALILLFLFAIVGLSSARMHSSSFASNRGFPTSLAWLVGYVFVVLLITARTTGAAPGYGPTKLQFVLAGVFVPLALIEVVSWLEVGRQQLSLIAIVVVTVLWVSTIQSGPVYDAVTRHWPTASTKPVWLDTAQREATLGRRVLCLSLKYPSIDSYLCNRFATSLQGKDDGVGGTWGQVSLGRLPVSYAVGQATGAKDLPWRIVVLDGIDQLHNPKAWWDPLVKLPGLEFVPISG